MSIVDKVSFASLSSSSTNEIYLPWAFSMPILRDFPGPKLDAFLMY